jgi:hypothetical protein
MRSERGGSCAGEFAPLAGFGGEAGGEFGEEDFCGEFEDGGFAEFGEED